MIIDLKYLQDNLQDTKDVCQTVYDHFSKIVYEGKQFDRFTSQLLLRQFHSQIGTILFLKTHVNNLQTRRYNGPCQLTPVNSLQTTKNKDN